MQSRLFRLVIVLSIIAASICSVIAIKSYKDYADFAASAKIWLPMSIKLQNSCGPTQDLPCEKYDFTKDPFVTVSQVSNGAYGNMIVSLIGIGVIPALLFSIFYASRWVYSGSSKKPERTEA